MEEESSSNSWILILLVGLGLAGGIGISTALTGTPDDSDGTKFATIIMNDTSEYKNMKLEIEGEIYPVLGEIRIPKGEHLATFSADRCDSLEIEYSGEEEGDAATVLSNVSLTCEESSEEGDEITEEDFLLAQYTSGSEERDGELEDFLFDGSVEIDEEAFRSISFD